MELLLLCVYLVLLLLHLVLLVRSVKKKRWTVLFAVQGLSCCLAVGLTLWFAHLPGRGIMPGLTYFAEVMYSALAAVIYVAMLLIGVVVWAIQRYRNRKNSAGN